MLSGSVVLENIFAWLVLEVPIAAIIANDYPVIQAISLLFAIMFLLVNLIVDLTYRAVDLELSTKVVKMQISDNNSTIMLLRKCLHSKV